MKKNLKRVLVLTLAVVMTLALCSVALATSAGTGTAAAATATSTASVTVATGNTSDTLSAYKVVTATFNSAANTLTYAFSSTFTAFQASAAGAAYASLTPDGYCDLDSNSTELETLLGAFSAYVRSTSGVTPTYTATTDAAGSATFTNVAMGQYIIMGSGNSTGAIIYQTVTAEVVPVVQNGVYVLYPSYTVAMKTTTPHSGKTIDSGTVKDGDLNTASVGDTVNYTITATVPTYPAGATNTTFYMGDTLSNGLTLATAANAIAVKGYNTTTGAAGAALTYGTDYTVTISGQTLYIDFVYANIKAYDSVSASYAAVLNQNAVVGTAAGNGNSYDLIYSNDPFNGSTHTDHPGNTPGYGKDTSTQTVYTYALAINKFDSKTTTTKLSGATFEIYTTYSEANGYSGLVGTITTDANGYAAYSGLKAGTYYLKETVAPTGYKLLTAPVTVTVNKSASAFSAVTTTQTITYTTDVNAAKIKVQATNANGEKLYLTSANEVTTTATGNQAAYVASITTNVTAAGAAGSGTAAQGWYVQDVANTQGSNLPTTGGRGTLIFTIVGVCVMLGTAIALISRKRMSNKG